ncbi:MAG: type I-B CRISPR-associated protein Cas7/Cst2/DevR [Tissierellia bacterium]|nr:type I-B CRISPR-associated protein Cas7/Cst2/DevR [Tissierellia bacterium]
MNKALTLTIIARMTANYGEGLGNIGSVQKVFKNGKAYAIRSRESIKNALMVQSGLYDDLEVDVGKNVTQKTVNEDKNASNSPALEGGYMNTADKSEGGTTKIRKSSFYLTDAIDFDPFINETRFHNNLFLAQTSAKQQGINLQEGAKEAGLMPYQYEYSKSLKAYSMTIDLDRIGVDDNFHDQADPKERARRVHALLDGVANLSLVVRGNLDNAEPLFIVGGLGDKKTHYFENVISLEDQKLKISQDLKDKLDKGYQTGLLRGGNFANEEAIEKELSPLKMDDFFKKLKDEVTAYYEGLED